MATYAEKTSVASEKSRAEIESILTRYGATCYAYAWNGDHASIAFEMEGRRVQFKLPLPSREDKAFTRTPTNKPRSAKQAEVAYEQGVRQKWRALALVIKAKLEAVESGITVFDDEFMAHLMLPNGQTVGNWMRPQIEVAYQDGVMPPLMLSEGAS